MQPHSERRGTGQCRFHHCAERRQYAEVRGGTRVTTHFLATGITGQDGSYPAEFPPEKGHEVNGPIRGCSQFTAQPPRARGRVAAVRRFGAMASVRLPVLGDQIRASHLGSVRRG